MIADANTVSMRIVICLKNYNGGHHSLLVVKNLPADTGDSRDINLIPGLGKIPWRRKWQPAQIFLPGKSHRPRSIWILLKHRHENVLDYSLNSEMEVRIRSENQHVLTKLPFLTLKKSEIHS